MTIETYEAPAVYWGTNIDEKVIEKNFESFIHKFKVEGQEYYMY